MISMSTTPLKTIQLRSTSSSSWEDAIAKTKAQVELQFSNIQSLKVIEKTTWIDEAGNNSYLIDALLTYSPHLS